MPFSRAVVWYVQYSHTPYSYLVMHMYMYIGKKKKKKMNKTEIFTFGFLRFENGKQNYL